MFDYFIVRCYNIMAEKNNTIEYTIDNERGELGETRNTSEL